MTKRLLWLDDIRNPMDGVWVDWLDENTKDDFDYDITWVKSGEEFVEYITEYGLPDLVCFDHDLGEEDGKTLDGYDCAKWLVDYCVDNDEALPRWLIQSANPVGAKNINNYLQNFLKTQS